MTTRLRWHCVHALVAGGIACAMAESAAVKVSVVRRTSAPAAFEEEISTVTSAVG